MYDIETHSEMVPTAARRLLFRDAYALQTPAEIVAWWERRRLAYNIAVGAAGLASLITIWGLGSIGPHAGAFRGPPIIAVVVYGVLANIAFTSGWITELLVRPWLGRRSGTVGATLFRYGLAFSVGLSLIPTAVAVANFGFRVLRWIISTAA